MSVRAIAKEIKLSPRKVGVVAALVRGQSVNDAVTILDHTPRRSAEIVRKTIQSAAANAEHNHNYKPASLYIETVSVTPGPRMKRGRIAARGRYIPFQKKTAHLLVVVNGEQRAAKKPTATKSSTKKAETAPISKEAKGKKG